MADSPRITRRTLLALVGVSTTTALAGCSAQTDGGTETRPAAEATDGGETASTAEEPTTPTEETPTEAAATSEQRIRVDSGRLRDTRLTPVLTGFRPNTAVTLVTTATDALDRTWSSTATFRTDDDGTVSLADQAPVDGTYQGERSMGFVWSMRRESVPEPSFFVPDPPELTLTLSARVDGTTQAETSVVRRFVAPTVTHRRVESEQLVGHYYEPATDTPQPGVVALHGAGNQPLRNYGRLLASHGIPTLAVKWFGEEAPLPDQLSRVPVEYVQRAIEWLRSRDAVADDEVGLVGHSKGAEYALLAATVDDDVGAVVAIAPSAYVWQSPTQGVSETSWTVDGEPLPAVPFPEDPQPPERVRGRTKSVGTLEDAIERASEADLAAARIPVEEATGDVLLVAGGQDGVWPSVRMAETVVERLDTTDFAHEYEALTYPDAGHVITIPYRPTTYEMLGGGLYLGGEPGAIAAAEADAWPQTVSWFERALTSED